MATPATAAGADGGPAPAAIETGTAEAEPTLHETLEAELFKLGADPAKVDHILALVADINTELLESVCG
jgi:hypothetical protein